MTKRYPARITTIGSGLLTAILLLGAGQPGSLPAADPMAERKDDGTLFGLTSVWALHLEMSAGEYDALQPALPAFPGPGARPPASEATGDAKHGEAVSLGVRQIACRLNAAEGITAPEARCEAGSGTPTGGAQSSQAV